MPHALTERLCAAFAPPKALTFPLAGIDVSVSGVKAVRLIDGAHGLTLAAYAEHALPTGVFTNGEIVDHKAVGAAISTVAKTIDVSCVTAALPESKSFLFETSVQGNTPHARRLGIEQHLDELVPLPPQETTFDTVSVGYDDDGTTRLVGTGFALRIVTDMMAAFDEVDVSLRALECEMFALARSLLPPGDESTILIIDIGKTTTKLAIIERLVPRFATTIGIGGHALTLAVQKHFGVTEPEARRIKAERGIVPAPGNEDYIAAMLSTVSAIRDEVMSRFNYWQERAAAERMHEPISQVILVGGNASVRGLPEYFGGVLKVPVATGDVFTNFASRNTWVPQINYAESLAYATVIGLALYGRHADTPYE